MCAIVMWVNVLFIKHITHAYLFAHQFINDRIKLELSVCRIIVVVVVAIVVQAQAHTHKHNKYLIVKRKIKLEKSKLNTVKASFTTNPQIFIIHTEYLPVLLLLLQLLLYQSILETERVSVGSCFCSRYRSIE